MSKKQSRVTLSTIEVEYMAATHACKEAIWLHRSFSDIGFKQKATRLDFDSHSVIILVNNPTYHLKMKHIDVQYHFLRDMVERNKALLKTFDTLENVTNPLTKYESTEKFS